MIYYFFLMSLFYFLSLNFKTSKNKNTLLFFSFFLLLLILGSRYYIGGDYFGYMNLYNKMDNASITTLIYNYEFFYYLIIFFCNKLNLGYFFSNFVLYFIFLLFFFKYSQKYENVFFILLISIPILFIPLSVNFVRQGIAIVIFLFSIDFLSKKDFSNFFFYIFVASLFHKFAIIYCFLYFFVQEDNKKIFKFFIIISFILTFVTICYFLKINPFHIYINKFLWSLSIYLNNEYPIMPKGLLFRSLLLNLSFFIMIYFKTHFKKYDEFKIWNGVGFAIIITTVISIFYPFLGSRVIIFWVPLSIFVFGRLLEMKSKYQPIYQNMISIFFIIYFVTWINFSPFKNFFTPYKSIFFL